MKTLIGLGNPGEKYKNNRHNVGHMFVDFCIKRLTSSRVNEFKYLKTDCFMNVSGKYIKKQVPRSMLQALYVAHDDLDIPFEKFKIQFGTGPKLHNGILSVEEELGTSEFWRIRIGVDNRGENKIDGETYSLQDFTAEELKQLQTVFENIYKQLQTQKII